MLSYNFMMWMMLYNISNVVNLKTFICLRCDAAALRTLFVYITKILKFYNGKCLFQWLLHHWIPCGRIIVIAIVIYFLAPNFLVKLVLWLYVKSFFIRKLYRTPFYTKFVETPRESSHWHLILLLTEIFKFE